MIIVAGSIDVAPELRDSFLESRKEATLAARTEDGCIDYAFSADIVDPGRVRLFEIWESREALDAHTARMRGRAVARCSPGNRSHRRVLRDLSWAEPTLKLDGEVTSGGSVQAGRRLPMFPLENVLLPGEPLPLHVFEPRYRVLTADCLEGDREFGVVLIARGREVGGGDERFASGTIAHIETAQPFEDGRWALLAHGTTRIRIRSWVAEEPYPIALVEPALSVGNDVPLPLGDLELAVRRVRALFSELGATPALPARMEFDEDPEIALWQLAALLPITPIDRQRLLETDDIATRFGQLASLAADQTEDLTRLLAEGND